MFGSIAHWEHDERPPARRDRRAGVLEQQHQLAEARPAALTVGQHPHVVAL